MPGKLTLRRYGRSAMLSCGRVLQSIGFAAYRRLPVSDNFRWKLVISFFRFFAPVMRHTSAWNAFVMESRWRADAPDWVSSSDDRCHMRRRCAPPIDRADGKDDFVIWGVVDWHFRKQRPQHLAVELARRGHRVFYISPAFINSDVPGFEAAAIEDAAGIYTVRLTAASGLRIYEPAAWNDSFDQLRTSVGELFTWAGIRTPTSLVDYPGWASIALSVSGNRVCYDCMDFVSGFENSTPELVEQEERLLRNADLVIASSEQLFETAVGINPSTVLVRNGCEYNHFSAHPVDVFRGTDGRRVIGYFGAIAEWFDEELVGRVAERFSDCQVLLVGADSAGNLDTLSRHPNVLATGEIPYSELPFWFHAMDVCLVPFQINDLTRATNPVKVYEYLSGGKPVVATNLPELELPDFRGLVYRSESHTQFLSDVQQALDESQDSPLRQRRRDFALTQSWTSRAAAIVDAISELPTPVVSIVIVTWNNLDLTRLCIESIQADRSSPFELIIVDNASTDGTVEYLRQLECDGARIILNEANVGFAAANNQGLSIASGQFLMLLNNDTVVTPGWLGAMLRHFQRDPSIGLLGPITNNIGNEARVPTTYTCHEELLTESLQLTTSKMGESFDISVLAFFCVMFPRAVHTEAGDLDEQFGLGFFEDDDYCRRVRQTGRRIVCAEDVFIHHELSASFGKLDPGQRQNLFESNRAKFEMKWGNWTPHAYRAA